MESARYEMTSLSIVSASTHCFVSSLTGVTARWVRVEKDEDDYSRPICALGEGPNLHPHNEECLVSSISEICNSDPDKFGGKLIGLRKIIKI